jgi:hypothetical protein
VYLVKPERTYYKDGSRGMNPRRAVQFPIESIR